MKTFIEVNFSLKIREACKRKNLLLVLTDYTDKHRWSV